jgi:signal transduction histidine kinase
MDPYGLNYRGRLLSRISGVESRFLGRARWGPTREQGVDGRGMLLGRVFRRVSNGVVLASLGLAAAVLGLGLSYMAPAGRLDNNLYDWFFRLAPARGGPGPAAVLAFDDRTLLETGGVRGMRRALAAALERVAAVQPRAVAVDLTLAEAGSEAEDAALAAAFARTPRLVLACEMLADGTGWQDPIARFGAHAAGVGHVGALPGPYDEVNRRIPLERVAGRDRRWALAVEVVRVLAGAPAVDSSPFDVRVGGTSIRSRWDEGRPMRVRYRDPGGMVRVSVREVLRDPAAAEKLRGKVVFAGVTAQSAVSDRLFTPLSAGIPMPGVEIHAQAFETMVRGDFLEDAPPAYGLLLALASGGLLAAVFAFLDGWRAWTAAGAAILLAHLLPYAAFTRGVVLAPAGVMAPAWLAGLACGVWKYYFVRRRLRESEAATARYQQAFHFVAHEMRTPLTAIQGSSELITRYRLPEEKQKELGRMINAESKRLARMITTFLDVEKLTAGQMELRKTRFELRGLVDTCVERARPLAEGKSIRLECGELPSARVDGDRELLEYAVYNLVTNAIKYSPAGSEVRIFAGTSRGALRLSVRDQGMGMNAEEVKAIFTKFYRTGKAIASGETGTGIGLSIVDQIVSHHGGRIDVASEPDKGSCFTVELPAGTVHRGTVH